jgi:hypothetical protein
MQKGRYDRYDRYGRYVSRSGFSISCGSRQVRHQWDINVCHFQKQRNVKIEKCYLTQIRKILQYNQFQNSPKFDIIYWDKNAEFPLINKILEMHTEKIETQLTDDRNVLKVQVLDNRWLISSLRHQSNRRIS